MDSDSLDVFFCLVRTQVSEYILSWNFVNSFCLLNRLSSELVTFSIWTIACVVVGDRRTDSNSVDNVVIIVILIKIMPNVLLLTYILKQ